MAPPMCWSTLPCAKVLGKSPGRPRLPGALDQTSKHRKIMLKRFWKTPPGILGQPPNARLPGNVPDTRPRGIIATCWQEISGIP